MSLSYHSQTLKVVYNLFPTRSPVHEGQRSGRVLSVNPEDPESLAEIYDFLVRRSGKLATAVTFPLVVGKVKLHRQGYSRKEDITTQKSDSKNTPEASASLQRELPTVRIISDPTEIREVSTKIGVPAPPGWITLDELAFKLGLSKERDRKKLQGRITRLGKEFEAQKGVFLGPGGRYVLHLSPRLLPLLRSRTVDMGGVVESEVAGPPYLEYIPHPPRRHQTPLGSGENLRLLMPRQYARNMSKGSKGAALVEMMESIKLLKEELVGLPIVPYSILCQQHDTQFRARPEGEQSWLEELKEQFERLHNLRESFNPNEKRVHANKLLKHLKVERKALDALCDDGQLRIGPLFSVVGRTLEELLETPLIIWEHSWLFTSDDHGTEIDPVRKAKKILSNVRSYQQKFGEFYYRHLDTYFAASRRIVSETDIDLASAFSELATITYEHGGKNIRRNTLGPRLLGFRERARSQIEDSRAADSCLPRDSSLVIETISTEDVHRSGKDGALHEFVSGVLLKDSTLAEKECLGLYFGLNGVECSYEEVGRHRGVSRERVRQVIHKGLSKLKRKLLTGNHLEAAMEIIGDQSSLELLKLRILKTLIDFNLSSVGRNHKQAIDNFRHMQTVFEEVDHISEQDARSIIQEQADRLLPVVEKFRSDPDKGTTQEFKVWSQIEEWAATTTQESS